MINWDITEEESNLINKIARRTITMGEKVGSVYSMLDVVMDISATHGNGCSLKLQELLDADDFNFAQDVFGIRHHIDRRTGKLGDCFVPRYAV